MTSLQIGDVIWVAFPHVETNRVKSRPALLVSIATLGPSRTLGWALMITSADNAPWPGDVEIVDHMAINLPVPSRIRTEKIATLDLAGAHFLGSLPMTLMDSVRRAMQNYMTVQ